MLRVFFFWNASNEANYKIKSLTFEMKVSKIQKSNNALQNS